MKRVQAAGWGRRAWRGGRAVAVARQRPEAGGCGRCATHMQPTLKIGEGTTDGWARKAQCGQQLLNLF
jgi:hypothetical protein